MRRLVLLTVAAALGVAGFAPATASGEEITKKVFWILDHPYDCVQDCDGPPDS